MRCNSGSALPALVAASAIAVAGGLWLSLPACEETAPGADAGADAGVDASRADVALIPDAMTPDAEIVHPGPISEIQYAFCDEPFFQLPIGGPDEYTFGHSLWNTRLSYSRGPRGSEFVVDVYLLDLQTCVEYRLTEGIASTSTWLRDSEVLYQDGKEVLEPSFYCSDLYRYDLETWLPERLTSLPQCEENARSNERFIAYERNTRLEGYDSPRENLVWDLETGTTTQYAPPEALAGNYDISDRYLVWSGYTQLTGSLGKDVYYMDLDTGETVHIPRSADYYCYKVRVWGEYMTYHCSEYWTSHPYHLFLRHIPTGQELQLDDPASDDHGIMVGVLYKNLVSWNTSRFMGEVGTFEDRTDIEMYDIDTGVRRRLTSGPSMLAIGYVYLPYALFGMPAPPYGNNVMYYYIANLESLGVVDATGNLIPGDPVIDPPPGP